MKDKTSEQELVEDLITILASFSGKLQGVGSHKQRRWRGVKRLRANSFTPPEEYTHLTYAVKNDKREESSFLLREYRKLLDKALDYLWEGARIEVESRTDRKGRHGRTVRITLPSKMDVYKRLRDELEGVNVLASHYVDEATDDAFSILKPWRKGVKGRISLRKPRVEKA